MGKLPKQTDRRSLIRRFRELGWSGPHGGSGRHPEYMQNGSKVFHLPQKHSKRSVTGEGKLKDFLNQAGITVDEWMGTEASDDDDNDGEQVDAVE